jgi:hypothetical protein
MTCKLIAIAFLGLWLALLSIEALEQAALLEFAEQETDRAVDEAIAGFAMALLEEHHGESYAREPSSSTSAAIDLHDTVINVAGAWRQASSDHAPPTEDGIPIYARQQKLRI